MIFSALFTHVIFQKIVQVFPLYVFMNNVTPLIEYIHTSPPHPSNTTINTYVDFSEKVKSSDNVPHMYKFINNNIIFKIYTF